MYLLTDAGKPKKGELRVQLMGSGTILREAIEAAALLEKDFGVTADIWSCPSYNELRRDGFDAERWNRLHPEDTQRKAYVTELLEDRRGRLLRLPTMCVRMRTRSARSCRPPSPCWAPMASAVRIPVQTCVASSKWTGTTSRMPRLRHWPRTGR